MEEQPVVSEVEQAPAPVPAAGRKRGETPRQSCPRQIRLYKTGGQGPSQAKAVMQLSLPFSAALAGERRSPEALFRRRRSLSDRPLLALTSHTISSEQRVGSLTFLRCHLPSIRRILASAPHLPFLPRRIATRPLPRLPRLVLFIMEHQVMRQRHELTGEFHLRGIHPMLERHPLVEPS